MADLDHKRCPAAVRRPATALWLLALAGCRGPLHTQVLTVAPSSAYGSAVHAATAAAAERAPSSQAAGNLLPATRWHDLGAERGSLLAAAGAFGLDDHAAPAPASAGRVHLFADPQLAWAVQDPQPDAPQEPPQERWSDFLPLGREAVLAAGYELPRAFGFSVASTRLRRDIEVDEVRTGVDGAAPQPVGFLAVEADSTVDNVMGRLDAWIFPFWNVSVLGGWTWNESDSEVTVTIPLPADPRDVTFRVPTRQDGPTLGFEVEQGPVTPYSLQVGGSYEFDDAYGVVLEYHMLKDVRMLVVSAALRF